MTIQLNKHITNQIFPYLLSNNLWNSVRGEGNQIFRNFV